MSNQMKRYARGWGLSYLIKFACFMYIHLTFRKQKTGAVNIKTQKTHIRTHAQRERERINIESIKVSVDLLETISD